MHSLLHGSTCTLRDARLGGAQFARPNVFSYFLVRAVRQHAAVLHELMLASILVAAVLLALQTASALPQNAAAIPLRHPFFSESVRELDAAESLKSRRRLDDAMPVLASRRDVQPELRRVDDSMSVLARGDMQPAESPSELRSGDIISRNEFSYDGGGQYTYTFKSPDGQTRLLLYYKKGFIELLTDLAMQNATDAKLVWTASLPPDFDGSINGATLQMTVSHAHTQLHSTLTLVYNILICYICLFVNACIFSVCVNTTAQGQSHLAE
jgi:hypothetical protein